MAQLIEVHEFDENTTGHTKSRVINVHYIIGVTDHQTKKDWCEIIVYDRIKRATETVCAKHSKDELIRMANT